MSDLRQLTAAELQVILADPADPQCGFAALELGRRNDSDSIPALIACLQVADRGVAESAEAALVSIGGEHLSAQLQDCLRSEDLGLRNLAIGILEKLGDDAVETVTPLVKDTDPDIRLFALEILLRIGRPSVLAPVLQALDDENVNVATAAARSLGALGMGEAVNFLVPCLERENWLACAAATSLGQLGGEDALRALMELPESAPGTLRFAAISALGELGDPSAINYLRTVVGSGPGPLKELAVQATVQILDKAYNEIVDDAAEYLGIETLIKFLKSKSENTVRSTASLLAKLKREGLEAALYELLLEDDRELNVHLEQILVQRELEELRPLVRILDNRSLSFHTHRTCVRALAATGQDEAIEALVAHLRYGDAGLKMELVRALGQFNTPESIAAIVRQTEAKDEFVRCTLAEILDPNRSEDEFAAAMQLCGDASAAVRNKVRERFGRLMNSELRSRLLAELEEAKGVTLETLVALLGSGTDRDLAERLQQMLPDADEGLFAAILRALPNVVDDLGEAAVEQLSLILKERLKDSNAGIRLAAVKALRHFHTGVAANDFLELVESDAAPRVAYEAAMSLRRYRSVELEATLVELLEDLSPYVQTALIEFLAESEDETIRQRVVRHSDSDLFTEAPLFEYSGDNG